MSVPAPIQINQAPALSMNEGELLSVLQNSLYPGAKAESIKLVIGYCKAAGLDPMQKPVHIVPMNVKVPGERGQKDSYEWRDVVMPGVGLYRTQAARTNALLGISEPEFGPSKTISWAAGENGDDKATLEYPEWCRVTVKRLVCGQVAEFTAIEYWTENYATAGRNTKAPNAMWQKRPRGQLAKCSQAQALRQAFPEMVGAAPTADELEGKTLDDDGGRTIDVTPQRVEQPQAKAKPAAQPPADAAPSSSEPSASKPEPSGEVTPETAATEGQIRMIRAKLKAGGLTDLDFSAHFGKPLTTEDGFPCFNKAEVNGILEWISSKAS